MRDEKVDIGLLPEEFNKLLKEYGDEVVAIVDEEVESISKETVKMLKKTSPKDSGDYAKGWKAQKKKTKFKYTTCLIKTLFNFDYAQFDSHVNGKVESHRSFIACIANGYRYGGGIPICPPANPTDKTLDFVTVSEIKGLKIVGAFLKLKAGKLLTLKQAKHQQIKQIKITTNGSYTVNVDGELYHDIPFEVKIVSDTLRVYIP